MTSVNPTASLTSCTVEKYQPGKVIVVGSHRVEILQYIAEGGFAQIYSVKFLEYANEFDREESPGSKDQLQVGDLACLKRVIVQDQNGLNELRNEVNVMKKLVGAPNIVQYYDSNASRLRNGTDSQPQENKFEVLLLMELCPNKSLLDYMNLRLATKLSEQEILEVMYDVSLAIAQMHYLRKPLIHRDIKIENVLVDQKNRFKLCDFGSTSTCFPMVVTHRDIAYLTQNIYVHTTPQYRSPEMIDLYRCLPIDEKSDIWALGIFLYKLLFFTTPFERTGQFAILHSKFEFPQNNYSFKLINLIIVMLSENPNLRPNIYQVLHQICQLKQVPIPIADKYGLGAYNFDYYMLFQNNLQKVQVDMFNIKRKQFEHNGQLDESDTKTLDQLFMNTFQVVSTMPIPAGNVSRDVDSQENIMTNKPGSIGENYYPTVNELNRYIDEHEENGSAAAENIQQPWNGAPTGGDPFHISSRPEEPETNRIHRGQLNSSNSLTSSSSEDVEDATGQGKRVFGVAQSPIPGAASPVVETVPNAPLKQYKSNNPFPRMGYDQPAVNVDAGPNSSAFFAETAAQSLSHARAQSQQPQPQQPQEISQHTSQRSYGVTQDAASLIYANKYGEGVSVVPHQKQYIPATRPAMQPVAQTLTSSQQQQISQQTQCEQVQQQQKQQQQQHMIQQAQEQTQHMQQQQQNQQQNQQQSQMLPPPVPPHPKRHAQASVTSQRSEGSTESTVKPKETPSNSMSPPPMAPRPNHHLGESLIDLSPTKETPQAKPKKRPSDESKNTHFQNKNENSRVRRSVSMSSSHRNPLIEPPTSESIDIDLDALKRKSLDVRLQKIKVNDSKRGQSPLSESHRSSGSKASGTTGTQPLSADSISDIKRDISRARQSLDLERVRKEAMAQDPGTRKKHLFSLFRNEKR
ncbi:uncharacterized protein KNAG_0H01220 [Huiozyma naganishii CBS 8797]|uniref:Protein kinase domain-containing protein n=1 Tax=Huiozyma naganishii (strain ATCC MYA-139 / BCRC 22969 / CBS 8797 / KCTC 17520 / NBRC 10181 / NCYC 3082 / Yp74L-3) TaxID=1071383 RepID=J7R9K3_HUIN7|nr:hypothetical protein KNAG_0H01220 [Kazachstania naganishii CBS 8797]CCK71535.1 hypothetical protein KNAG_0H01220 [Kazachstania naganishii CBS 8797]